MKKFPKRIIDKNNLENRLDLGLHKSIICYKVFTQQNTVKYCL